MLNDWRQQILIIVWWRCRWMIAQVGWIPLVITLFCLLGVGHQLYSRQMQQSALIALQPRIDQARLAHHSHPLDRIATPLSDVAVTQTDDHVAMSTMLAQLPAPGDLHAWMSDILKTAQKYHVLLNTGDYQWHPGTLYAATRIQQFDMRFVIESDYQTSHRFVADMLNQHPTLALTGWDMRKNETAQSVVESTLTFSVFMRSQPDDR